MNTFPEKPSVLPKRAILDWVGVTIAGSNEPVTRIVFEHVQTDESRW